MLICHCHMLRDAIVSVCFILAGRKGEAILSIGADHLLVILIQIKSIWRWKDFVAAGICVLEASSVLCGLWWEWSFCSSPFICVPLTAHCGCPVRRSRKNVCCYLPKECVETCFLFYTLHVNNGTTGCTKFTVETCLINALLICLQIWCVFSIALPLYTIYHHNNEYYDDILITTTPLTAFDEEAQRGGFSCSSF